jgi:hypothetical protein
MKATVSTGGVNMEAAINSIQPKMKETNYWAKYCPRGTAHTVHPADSIRENPPHLEGSFSKTEAAPTDSLGVRRQYHRGVHLGTPCYVLPRCIRPFEAPHTTKGDEEVPLRVPGVLLHSPPIQRAIAG